MTGCCPNCLVQLDVMDTAETVICPECGCWCHPEHLLSERQRQERTARKVATVTGGVTRYESPPEIDWRDRHGFEGDDT